MAEQDQTATEATPEPTETAAAAAVEAPAPASEAVPQGEAAPAATPPAPAPADNVDWRDKRIATLTARLREAQEALAASAKPKEAPAGALQGPTEAELAARVEARAAELSASKAFNDACNAAAVQGREIYGETEFNSRVAELVKLRDVADPASVTRYNTFLAAAIETGQAPKLIDMLGKDLNEAARILDLPPIKMGIELARLAEREAEEVSKAPKPIKPVGARAAAHTEIDPTDPTRAGQLSTAEWMRRREAQLAKREGRQAR